MHSKNEDFNNISEIEYEQNNIGADKEEIINENLDIKEDEKENEEDIKDSQSQKQNKEEGDFPNNNNIVNDSQNENYNTLKNNSIKNDNLNYDEHNLNNEENKDSNLQQGEITDSAMKRMKNNDGLDEYDNNFNNHDQFYNKMKNIFDE